MINIKSGLILEYLKNSAWRTVVIFGSPTCSSCNKVTKIFVPLFEQTHVDTEFYFLDGDKFPKIADMFKIEYYPTLIYFEGGEEKKRIQSSNIKEIDLALFKK